MKMQEDNKIILEIIQEEVKEPYTGEYVCSFSYECKEADSWNKPIRMKGKKEEVDEYIKINNAAYV